jgi:hypothetical protein
VPVEFRGNTGAPIQQLFVANGVAIEIDCSSTNTARLRSSAEDGFAKSVFSEDHATSTDGDGIVEDADDQSTTMQYSLDTDFDFNNLIVLTEVAVGNSGQPGIYEGTFAHTTNFALSNVVTGVYLASINTNTSPGNCVFVGTTQRD